MISKLSRVGTSNSPRGVGTIADLSILAGFVYFVVGILSLFIAVIYGIMMIGGGVILVALGFALGNLRSWAWWGTVIINLGICIANSPLITNTSLYNIISMAIAIIIIVYLLSPTVRNQFQ